MPGNRVPFVPVEHDPPVDKLTDDYPIRLTTGRRLDSYNTGVQTGGYTSPLRRGESLDISPEDAERLGLAEGEQVEVRSNGLAVSARLAVRERIRPGSAFLIEGAAEQAANQLAGARSVEISREAGAGEPARREARETAG